MATKKRNTVAVCAELAEPAARELGLELWDVRFEKEGSGWFLRYFIDKEGGVDINDCENFSRKVDKLLDEADPIEQSYCLEVSSPGVERALVKPEHFERYLGSGVNVRLIRAKDGVREFTGKLLGYHDGDVTVETEDGARITVLKGEAAYVRLRDDFDYEGVELEHE